MPRSFPEFVATTAKMLNQRFLQLITRDPPRDDINMAVNISACFANEPGYGEGVTRAFFSYAAAVFADSTGSLPLAGQVSLDMGELSPVSMAVLASLLEALDQLPPEERHAAVSAAVLRVATETAMSGASSPSSRSCANCGMMLCFGGRQSGCPRATLSPSFWARPEPHVPSIIPTFSAP